MGAKLAHAAASSDFYLVFFFAANSGVRAHMSIEKIPFPSCRAHRLPFPPFNPNNTPPPHPRAPPPNVYPKACDACVSGGGLGGGATAMRRRGGEGHDGDDDDDDDAAVAADGEDDERLRR